MLFEKRYPRIPAERITPTIVLIAIGKNPIEGFSTIGCVIQTSEKTAKTNKSLLKASLFNKEYKRSSLITAIMARSIK